VIRTILFDLGNVIVPFDFKIGYARISELCSCPAVEIPVRLRASGLVQPFETGEISAEQFVREVSSILGLNATYAQFCELWTSVFLRETLIPESLLAELRERHRLLLLSNTNPIHFSMIRSNYPLLEHFHDFILSYEVRSAKPSPEIYREALARAECRPDECIFIDDMLINVEAAREQGMHAVQFESAGQVERELERLGVILTKSMTQES